jgi:hypothetical protein
VNTSSRAEVFNAEVAAITNAIHYLAQHPLPAHNIYIFSDNSSAISTLAQANSGYILRHRQLLQPSIDFLRNQNRQVFSIGFPAIATFLATKGWTL